MLRWLLGMVVLGLLAWTLASALRRPAPAAGADGAPMVIGSDWPRTVLHRDGRSTELAAPPTRLVLANATVVDLVCAVLPDPAGRIAGVADLARRSSAHADDPALAGVAAFGAFAAEAVLACEPDLVLCSPHNEAGTTAALRRAGVAVVAVPAPNDLAGVQRALRLIGRLLGQEAAVAATLADLDRRLAALHQGAARRRGLRALAYTNHVAGAWTGGRGTLHHDVIECTGMRNAADAMRGHVKLSTEQLLALDPDLLIVDGAVDDASHSSTQHFLAQPQQQVLRAVQTGAVVVLPEALYSSGSQHVVDAAERVATQVDALLAAGRIAARDGEPR